MSVEKNVKTRFWNLEKRKIRIATEEQDQHGRIIFCHTNYMSDELASTRKL